MKTAKLTMMTTLMALMLLAVGCKKENENTAERQQNNSTPMLQFNSFDEVIDYLVDEKKNKSNKDGFVSYAEYMEKEYKDLDPENFFKTKEEMIQYALEHHDKYQLILCEDGEYIFETRLYNHDYKYVANKDGMFQVKNKVYKIIEGGLVYTLESHIQELTDYVDNGFRNNDDVFSFVIFDDSVNTDKNNCLYCSNMHNWTKINEDNKLYFEIKLYLSNNNTRVTYKHYAKPYHHNFLGWFGCLRTITCSYNNQVVYKDAAGDWPRIGGNQWIPQYPYRWDFQESWTSTSGFETVKYEYDFIHSWMWEYEHPNTGGFGFNVLDARASTLDVGEIHVYCPKQYEIG
ncbi:MAG: hypothetical protein IKH44_00155 [Bacteroidales bacterium]|jgi:hypothetical protein|nr:hypothetical protein [Bacteroidales bacterium]